MGNVSDQRGRTRGLVASQDDAEVGLRYSLSTRSRARARRSHRTRRSMRASRRDRASAWAWPEGCPSRRRPQAMGRARWRPPRESPGLRGTHECLVEWCCLAGPAAKGRARYGSCWSARGEVPRCLVPHEDAGPSEALDVRHNGSTSPSQTRGATARSTHLCKLQPPKRPDQFCRANWGDYVGKRRGRRQTFQESRRRRTRGLGPSSGPRDCARLGASGVVDDLGNSAAALGVVLTRR